MPDLSAASLALIEIAASSAPIPERAEALLGGLRRLVPFDAAWVALAEPLSSGYTSLASVDLDDSTLEFLGGPVTARDIEMTGANQARFPIGPSDLPYPAEEVPTWTECLLPAGFREGLGVALFGPGGRQVGFVTVLSGSKEPPSPEMRHRLGRLTSVLAHGIDPMRSLLPAARLVRGATAGAVVRADGGTQPLPGLADHALLAAGSPVVGIAHAEIGAGHVYTSFLWPVGGRHAPDGHTRVTALASADDVPAVLTGMVLLSPPPYLRGLTPRELEVLGLLVNGCSNHAIASHLVVAPRTVAAHLEHILVKLGSQTRTLAAVRAERDGLYVPPLTLAPPRRP
ncbi:helix-turn-helix transcriptional regulator [Geodermatophilus ruber]|uniref:Regulatory protein, luxR family n=1 Tax=Geodermatophilus ruber TaxID=504800 RepID=A0A1I4ABG2_9ACTN|nr:helix-turn-helix transcriptional regulator [Geodermatophilus ruber]SFK53772.1 regulatory protein, luxR family [Geodermatophilus ruber]